MTSKPGYTRTNNAASQWYKDIPQEKLKKIWGPKKKIKDVQDLYYSGKDDNSVTQDDVEKYVDKMAQEFHQERKKQWLKGYMKNYISRHAKGMDLYKI